ncbi:L,D-transpeptidase [Camelimonas abortus]|uniref:L,D-transpeptidase n=1 Tax=Camelimonas abortus TaxID=1017184 RepID=A0ABV7LEE8_9HYPH
MRTFLRAALALASAAVLAGCYTTTPDPQLSPRDAEWLAQIPKAEDDPVYARYLLSTNETGEPPGVIVVDTKARQLFYVLPDNRVMRYGVAVGDEAFGWTGEAVIQRKAEWPDWHPPAEMKARWPHVRDMKGGPANPMGARALYLYQNGRDTLYRIHGTNEPEKIGRSVSSGCIRMRNIDVIDLYNRAPAGTRVVVK